MDHDNYENIGRLTGLGELPRVRLVMSFVPGRSHEEIADPYYGTQHDFVRVMEDLFLATAHIFDNLKARFSGYFRPEYGTGIVRGERDA